MRAVGEGNQPGWRAVREGENIGGRPLIFTSGRTYIQDTQYQNETGLGGESSQNQDGETF